MRFRATGDEGQAWCGKPRGHRPKVTWGCRVKAAETAGGGGVAGGGTGCEDFVGGGGAKGRRGLTPLP